MKKLSISILTCCCLSMSFTVGTCTNPDHSWYEFFGLLTRIATGSRNTGDNSTNEIFMVGVGNNGVILKSTGADTIRFTGRSSGTTQNLNDLRIQPTTFEPKMLAVGNNGTITLSTDLGETWTVSAPVTTASLYASDFNNATYFAVGDNGTILSSFNGTSWSLQTSGTTRNLKAISMHANSGGTLVAIGERGTIVRTTNSGSSWSNISLSDTTVNLYCISQKTRQNLNAVNFYVAGSSGKIYKSTDLGATWVLKNSGTTNTLRSIYFKGNDSGAVSGDNGTVRITTNAGETWFSDAYFNNVTGNITSISEMPRPARTFIALFNNTRMHIASEDSNFVVIGIRNISSEIPNGFSLSQNYPNPFNPSSKFKVQISKLSNVKVVVYDAAGKEVEVLVNEQLHPGTYEVDFNGSKYASGVYFYKLIAGDFVETKKMMLVK